MIARLRSEPQPLREARPDIEFSDELQVVITKGLQRNPDDRHQTAPEFDPRSRMPRAADRRAAASKGSFWEAVRPLAPSRSRFPLHGRSAPRACVRIGRLPTFSITI